MCNTRELKMKDEASLEVLSSGSLTCNRSGITDSDGKGKFWDKLGLESLSNGLEWSFGLYEDSSP